MVQTEDDKPMYLLKKSGILACEHCRVPLVKHEGSPVYLRCPRCGQTRLNAAHIREELQRARARNSK